MKTVQIGLRWSSSVSGGAERIFSELAAGLPREGVGFIGAVAGSPELAARTQGLIHSFAPEDAGTMTRLRGARKVLRELLRDERPDLVASHFAMYTLPIVDQLRKRPFVMHFHGPWALESQIEGGSLPTITAKRQIERTIYRRADRAVVLSQAFAELLHRAYGVPEEKIRIIPGAVDLDRFTASPSRAVAREQLGWPTDRPILLTVRRLVHRMGLQQLIEAMSLIRQRVPEALLMVAGSGALRPELEAQVKELQLDQNVRFLGFVPEELLPSIYRATDVSVVPTLALEGFGLVAAESLAAGTPALVTPVGGLPEIVRELSDRLLFASGKPSDLAAGLTSALCESASLPSEEACRAYAEAKFSRKLMTSRIVQVYREVAR